MSLPNPIIQQRLKQLQQKISSNPVIKQAYIQSQAKKTTSKKTSVGSGSSSGSAGLRKDGSSVVVQSGSSGGHLTGSKNTTPTDETITVKSMNQPVIIEWQDKKTGDINKAHTTYSNIDKFQTNNKQILSLYDYNKRKTVWKAIPDSGGVGLKDENVYITQHPSLHQEVQSKVYQDKPSGWSPVREIKKAPNKPDLNTGINERRAYTDYQAGVIDPFVSKPQTVKEELNLESYKSELQTKISMVKDQPQTPETRGILRNLESALNQSSGFHPDTKIVKEGRVNVKYVFKFPYAGAEKYIYYKSMVVDSKGSYKPDVLLATAFTGEDFLGLKSAYYQITGQRSKVIDTKIQAIHGTKSKSFTEFYFSSPMGVIGTTSVGASALGYATGTVSAVSVKAGTVLKGVMGVGFTGYAVKENIPVVSKAIKTGDYGNVVTSASTLGLSIATGFTGYKMGYTAGYGRAEAYLYGKATYKAGSVDMIRFKSGMKIIRNLQFVKSGKADGLNLYKDIARLDPKIASDVLGYLKANPKTVIGGSGASYTQIYGARQPRDIDLLVKQVGQAKGYIKGGSHVVDIHGFDMGGKGGRYLRFGVETQSPIKIGDFRYMRAGEQLARKGISSIMVETRYRHGLFEGFSSKGTMQAPKDIFDFVTHAKSLIGSTKTSRNPLNLYRGTVAQKNLDIFLNPRSSSSYGKTGGILNKTITNIAVKSFKTPTTLSYGGYGYGYGKSLYSMPIATGYKPSSYIKPLTMSYTPSVINKPYTATKTNYKKSYINMPNINKISNINYYNKTSDKKGYVPSIPKMPMSYPKTTSYKPSYSILPSVSLMSSPSKKAKMPQNLFSRRKSREFDVKSMPLRYYFREFGDIDLNKYLKEVKI